MASAYFCPYCGAQLAAGSCYCDSCSNEMLPQDRLTAAQWYHWLKLPYNAIMWAFGTAGGLAMAVIIGVGIQSSDIVDAEARWIWLMTAVCIGATIAAVIFTVAWFTVRKLFGRVAAQPMDRALCTAFTLAGATGFWPTLACIMAVL